MHVTPRNRAPMTTSSLAAAHRPAHQGELESAAEGMRHPQNEFGRLHVGSSLLAQPRLIPLVTRRALLLPKRLIETFDRREERSCIDHLLDGMTVHRERPERNW